MPKKIYAYDTVGYPLIPLLSRSAICVSEQGENLATPAGLEENAGTSPNNTIEVADIVPAPLPNTLDNRNIRNPKNIDNNINSKQVFSSASTGLYRRWILYSIFNGNPSVCANVENVFPHENENPKVGTVHTIVSRKNKVVYRIDAVTMYISCPTHHFL